MERMCLALGGTAAGAVAEGMAQGSRGQQAPLDHVVPIVMQKQLERAVAWDPIARAYGEWILRFGRPPAPVGERLERVLGNELGAQEPWYGPEGPIR